MALGRGGHHAFVSSDDFGGIRRRARRAAALDCRGAILPAAAVLTLSAVLAVLCGGCRPRRRRDDCHRSDPSAGRAAAPVRLLRTTPLPATRLLSTASPARKLRAILRPALSPPQPLPTS